MTLGLSLVVINLAKIDLLYIVLHCCRCVYLLLVLWSSAAWWCAASSPTFQFQIVARSKSELTLTLIFEATNPIANLTEAVYLVALLYW